MKSGLNFLRSPLNVVGPNGVKTFSTFIVRPESPKNIRAPITPAYAQKLISNGHKVIVVGNVLVKDRAFSYSEYQNAGAKIITAEEFNKKLIGGEFPSAIIVGVKELPKEVPLVDGYYSYFAHMFKGQDGAKAEMLRFIKASFEADRRGLPRPVMVDVEYLVNKEGKRVVAFGEPAGFNGAAIGIITWCRKMLGQEVNQEISSDFETGEKLLEYAKEQLREVFEKTGKSPNFTILGKNGRSGTGAWNFLKQLGVDPDKISALAREDTMKEGVNEWRDDLLPRIAQSEILLNCIYTPSGKSTPPLLKKGDNLGKLKVVSDVTCDVKPDNPIFGIEEATTFEKPVIEIDGIAITNIDRTPNMTARSSSEDFASKFFEVFNDANEEIEVNPFINASILTFERHFKMPYEAFNFGVGMADRYVGQISKSPEKELENFLIDLKKKNPNLDEKKLDDVKFFINEGAKQHFEDKKIVGQIAFGVLLDDIFSQEKTKELFNKPSGNVESHQVKPVANQNHQL